MNPHSKCPSYLIRNPYSYCFRMIVPKDLQKVVGKRELRYSLKTGYLRDAKYKARMLAGQVQPIFKYLRKRRAALSDLTDAQIQKLIQQYIKDSLEGLEKRYYGDDPPWEDAQEFYTYVDWLDDIRDTRITCLGTGDYKTVEKTVAGLLKKSGIQGIEKGSVAFIKICRGILQAELQLIPIEKKHMLGDYSYQDELATIFPGQFEQLPKPDAEISVLLSKIINDYMAENKRANNWGKRTVTEYETCAKLMLKVIGDVFVHTITFDTGRQFKETLTRLPPNILNSKKYKDKTIDEILSMKSDKILSVKTVNKYLDFANGVFKYARNHNYIPQNPIEGLRIRQKKRADENRAPFNKEDLKILFHSPEYLEDTHLHSYCFWLPVLALYTGCRLEELCQLHTEDVKQVKDVSVLDINADTPDKNLKTLSSKRIVPLHPFLTNELRFPEFVEDLKRAGEKRVFPYLKKINNRYGHAPGQWFSRYKIRRGIVPDEKGRKKDFHSFRKTFTTKLRHSSVELNMIKELDGHSIGDITAGTYSDRFPAEMLLENAISNLDYGIDLSRLKNSKFVSG